MKAIEIIGAMVYDSCLAEFSDLWEYEEHDTVEEWIKRIFGDFIVKSGEIKEGSYLAVWSYHEDNLPFLWHKDEHQPDAVLERVNPEDYPEYDRGIYLWRIEE